MERTFRTNILGMFWVTKAALKHMPAGSAIINTTSITAFKGSPQLVDYASTKGAILAFTRSLSQALCQQKQIRVNAVAPGPIWTPLIPASFDEEKHGEARRERRDGPRRPAGRGGAELHLPRGRERQFLHQRADAAPEWRDGGERVRQGQGGRYSPRTLHLFLWVGTRRAASADPQKGRVGFGEGILFPP